MRARLFFSSLPRRRIERNQQDDDRPMSSMNASRGTELIREKVHVLLAEWPNGEEMAVPALIASETGP